MVVSQGAVIVSTTAFFREKGAIILIDSSRNWVITMISIVAKANEKVTSDDHFWFLLFLLCGNGKQNQMNKEEVREIWKQGWTQVKKKQKKETGGGAGMKEK